MKVEHWFKVFAVMAMLVGQLTHAQKVEGNDTYETYKFTPDHDTWANSANPGANYGNNTYLSLNDRSGLAEIYLKFSGADLAALRGSSIASASLFLYQYQAAYSPGDAINARPVLADWDESSLTWSAKPAAGNVASSVELNSGNNAWREWKGFEPLVAQWLNGENFGFVLENNSDAQTGELFARFYSSEYSNSELRPYLSVATVSPEPASAALFLAGSAVILCRRYIRRNRKGSLKRGR